VRRHEAEFATCVFLSARWRSDESNPEVPLSNHVYVYGLNDPVLYTDPLGTCSEPGCGKAGRSSITTPWYATDWWNRDRPCLDYLEIETIDRDGHTHCRQRVWSEFLLEPSLGHRSTKEAPFCLTISPNGIVLATNGSTKDDEEESAAPGSGSPGGSPNNNLPGSPEHKADRWAKYKAKGGSWDYPRWSANYDENIVRATKANAARDAYMQQLGWGIKELEVEVEGVIRKLDIGDPLARRGIEFKTGNIGLSQEIRWEILRDQVLREQRWDIRWVFQGKPSKGLISELDKAGIPYTILGGK
jgi:hypothetical protein